LGVGRGANNPTPEEINVKKPEAIPAGKEQMAGHSEGDQGLKRVVVPQTKQKKTQRETYKEIS
jgi:hypothetical protein